MSTPISCGLFYGKRDDASTITILDKLANPNNSDLEDLDIIDSNEEDFDDDRLDQPSTSRISDDENEIYANEDTDSEDFDSEDELPLSEIKRRIEISQPIRSRIWYVEKDNDLTHNPPPFLSSREIKIQGETPLSFFMEIFPEELFQHIRTETIRYAVQSGKDVKITTADIKRFIAVNIMMTYIKYPSYRMYWSSNQGLRLDIIADSMPLKKYEEIKRFLHFTNNHDIPQDNNDSFIKIRPLLDTFAETFANACTPTEFMAIDEMIIPFKGRSKCKQYIQSKPHKWGFKVWVRAAADGYVSKFEMYQSRKTESKPKLGVIGDTVARLCSDIEGKNHKIFIDNLFTSLDTISFLKSRNIYVVGTIRSNRIAGASEKLVCEKDLKKRGRGSCSVTTSSDNISVLRWVDNNIVHMISSFVGKEPQDTVRRWDKTKKSHVNIPRPQAVIQYNKFMGGVDMADRMVAHYPHATKNKKFYVRIAFHFINVAIINSWILYREAKHCSISLVEYKAYIVHALLRMNTNPRGRPAHENTPPMKKKAWTKALREIRLDGIGHYPEKQELKNPPRCHYQNCVKRTRYMCKKCKEPVCPECLESFHQ